MCGIVGYVGESQAAPILLEGLSKLEYRGYDSAGMAVYDGKTTQTFSWSKGDFYFVEKPSHILNEGYPLDSISILPENGKYFVDLTREEKDNYKSKDSKDGEVIKFILESLNFKSADSL